MDVCEKVWEHFYEANEIFPQRQIVGIFLQGSQNYNLAYENSDVDTKLIIVPSFKDIALNHKAISTTHVRANNEHIDFKDIRLYMETFRKQNLNFLEILFTSYFVMGNSSYAKEWLRLVKRREDIARMNPYRAVKSMKGIALEKYHAMEHRYPSKVDIIDQFGYDCKQLHHLERVRFYLEDYIEGKPYAECLVPVGSEHDYLMGLKYNKYPLEQAREIANRGIEQVIKMADIFCEKTPEEENEEMRELLEDVSYQIMKLAIKTEFKND